MNVRGRFLKKLKPDEKIVPPLSIQEIHRRSSGNVYQLVGADASTLILTFNKQVKHVANRKRIGELLRCIYAVLDGEHLCGCLHGVLLHALPLVTSSFRTSLHPCGVCRPFGGYQGCQ